MINFSEEGIMMAISYLIPGFLINTMLTQTFKLDKYESSQTIYKFLLFSFLNICMFTSIDWVFVNWFDMMLVYNSTWILFLRNVLLPFLFSLMLLLITKKIRIQDMSLNTIISIIGIDSISKTNSAWDYVFYNIKEGGSYLVITLKTGSIIYGKFGSDSFSTYRNSYRDSIYLEKTYHDFTDHKETDYGILLETDQIESIRVVASRIISNEEE